MKPSNTTPVDWAGTGLDLLSSAVDQLLAYMRIFMLVVCFLATVWALSDINATVAFLQDPKTYGDSEAAKRFLVLALTLSAGLLALRLLTRQRDDTIIRYAMRSKYLSHQQKPQREKTGKTSDCA